MSAAGNAAAPVTLFPSAASAPVAANHAANLAPVFAPSPRGRMYSLAHAHDLGMTSTESLFVSRTKRRNQVTKCMRASDGKRVKLLVKKKKQQSGSGGRSSSTSIKDTWTSRRTGKNVPVTRVFDSDLEAEQCFPEQPSAGRAKKTKKERLDWVKKLPLSEFLLYITFAWDPSWPKGSKRRRSDVAESGKWRSTNGT
ncbi:unnamed protein product [Amoebophrya sp. A25]|nr:unnamed protein product [Amoebophrya sp. A25]|eukprot:GSA25T00006368001.1